MAAECTAAAAECTVAAEAGGMEAVAAAGTAVAVGGMAVAGMAAAGTAAAGVVDWDGAEGGAASMRSAHCRIITAGTPGTVDMAGPVTSAGLFGHPTAYARA
jgi:hypothetical protein